MTRARRWEDVLEVAAQHMDGFDEVNVATALHRLGKLARPRRAGRTVRSDPVFARLLGHVRRRAPAMSERQLSNILWGLAALGWGERDDDDARVVEDVLGALRGKVGECGQQELANVVWALATMGWRDAGAMRAVAREVARRDMRGFAPQAMSNLAWGFATLDVRDDELFGVLAAEVAERARVFEPQAVSNTMWAFSALGYRDARALRALTDQVLRRAADFRSQELSHVLLTAARLDLARADLLECLCAEFAARAARGETDEQTTANALWSLATLRHYDKGALDAFVELTVERAQGVKVLELVEVLWALAKLAHHPGQRALAEICAGLSARAADMDEQQWSKVMWALAVLQGTALPLFGDLAARLAASPAARERYGDLSTEAKSQLFQAIITARLEARSQGARGGPQLPLDLLRNLWRDWREYVCHVSLSAFHLDVSLALARLGVPHVNERTVEDGLKYIDVAIEQGDVRLAVEVDGPSHFTRNTAQPLGSTLLSRRVTRACGWHVLSIPHYEWPKDDPHAQAELLATRLAAAGVAVRNGTHTPAPAQSPPGAPRGSLAEALTAAGATLTPEEAGAASSMGIGQLADALQPYWGADISSEQMLVLCKRALGDVAAGTAARAEGGDGAAQGPARAPVASAEAEEEARRGEEAERREQLRAMPIRSLRPLLRDRGLPVSGLKNVLVERMLAYEREREGVEAVGGAAVRGAGDGRELTRGS
ncbi:unnamed protein product [Pedinophyceae sp. YPF-701]|nr:unnamed protein product [Pedinophyceae sp. YPF-701]